MKQWEESIFKDIRGSPNISSVFILETVGKQLKDRSNILRQ